MTDIDERAVIETAKTAKRVRDKVDRIMNGDQDWTEQTPKRREFTTSAGATLPLRGIPAMLVRQLYADETGKPKPPIVEVTYGKKTVKETNEHDPDYLAAMAAWTEARNFRIMVYVVARGVCLDPNKTESEHLAAFFPGSNVAERKYAWILEMLDNDEEAAALMMTILGQTVPTEKGIRDAEDRFPGDSESAQHNAVPTAESASND